jgi:peptide/nickel transport system permease protein
MGFRPVLLWSDLLIYALLVGGGISLFYAWRREYWRSAFRQVSTHRVAMVSFGILCVYALVAVLDTLHFRPADEDAAGGRVTSVLDVLCGSLRERSETTYSAPFATRSFAMETVERDGQQIREYPRLKHAAVNLADPDAEAGGDIRARALTGLGWGVAAGLFCFAACGLWRKRQAARGTPPAGTGGWWTAGFLTLVAVLVCEAVTLNRNGGYHIFGTDKAGLDVFYVALKSVRTGLVIGTLTTLIVTPFAILFGVLAGYFGGWVDDVVQYVYTTLSSIPDILLISAAMLILSVGLTREETVLSADKRLVYLCIIMGITSWTGLCRLIRAEVLKLREVEYVQAAEAFGVSRVQIMLRHLVPNVMHLVLISTVLRFSGLVLAEAVLAYVGIGVDPSTQSWGNMINQARLELARDPMVWWSLVAAFVFMLGLVLPANLFGDAVRDALDPRLRVR